MNSVHFFTPINYIHPERTLKEFFYSGLEDFFSIGSEVAEINVSGLEGAYIRKNKPLEYKKIILVSCRNFCILFVLFSLAASKSRYLNSNIYCNHIINKLLNSSRFISLFLVSCFALKFFFRKTNNFYTYSFLKENHQGEAPQTDLLPINKCSINGKQIDFSNGYYFHCTQNRQRLQGIFNRQIVYVDNQSRFEGAWVSTTPEVGSYGNYILAFNRKIEQLPLNMGFIQTNGLSRYWAGFRDRIPVNSSTLAYVIYIEDSSDRKPIQWPEFLKEVPYYQFSWEEFRKFISLTGRRFVDPGLFIPSHWPQNAMFLL